jgi:hypothetical protein
VISTPDHTHYLPAMLALQHGLDVYCEKPLTQTIAQARRLLHDGDRERLRHTDGHADPQPTCNVPPHRRGDPGLAPWAPCAK